MADRTAVCGPIPISCVAFCTSAEERRYWALARPYVTTAAASGNLRWHNTRTVYQLALLTRLRRHPRAQQAGGMPTFAIIRRASFSAAQKCNRSDVLVATTRHRPWLLCREETEVCELDCLHATDGGDRSHSSWLEERIVLFQLVVCINGYY